MLGAIVNTLAIIVVSLLGLVFKGGIPKKYNVTIMYAISLAVILIGLRIAFKTDGILLVVFSPVIGSSIGLTKLDSTLTLQWLSGFPA